MFQLCFDYVFDYVSTTLGKKFSQQFVDTWPQHLTNNLLTHGPNV
jgi:hypothetical protein